MEVRALLVHALARLEHFGLRGFVIFTGPVAGEQLAMIDGLAAQWNAVPGRALHVIATGVNRCAAAPISPEHAGVFAALVSGLIDTVRGPRA